MKNPVLLTPVGEALEGVTVTQQDHDLELLIDYCRKQVEIEAAGSGKAMAIYWARRMTGHTHQRRDEIKAAWDRAIERQIEGTTA